ncbi:D-alanyl-D-alanine carboxypeptidase [Microbispora sp. RL4-1S]|uniref:D-alanyl-D-alanine carboxypeptidase n=2 Tax=Microbispora oryzae TaxID=2806554 RepID=A0A941AQI2_9ACTN|nr:D-alanyl-D-alanine carboxypeptidase [Microbispora oryzae]
MTTALAGVPPAQASGPARLGAPPADRVIGGERLAGRGLIAPQGVPAPPKTEASAFLIADADTGAVLAAKDPHGHYMPASTLKTLTAVTLIPKLDKDRVIKPSKWACDEEGSAVGLVPKPIYKVHDLMRALLMVSGNDAADALAEANGSLRETLADMNERARQLQAYDTVAKSPNGLDRPGQRSSPYDLALIARAGLAMPDFREYISTKTADFPAPKGHYEIANHNKLLGRYKGMMGVKNGWTTKALGSFVGAAKRDGHTIIVVIMHHPGGFWEEVAKLLDWGFEVRGKAAPVGELVGPAPSPTPSPPAGAVRAGGTPAPPGAARNAGGAGKSAWQGAAPGVAAAVLGAGVAGGVALLMYGRLRRRRRDEE